RECGWAQDLHRERAVRRYLDRRHRDGHRGPAHRRRQRSVGRHSRAAQVGSGFSRTVGTLYSFWAMNILKRLSGALASAWIVGIALASQSPAIARGAQETSEKRPQDAASAKAR